jgi:hypothetical protein
LLGRLGSKIHNLGLFTKTSKSRLCLIELGVVAGDLLPQECYGATCLSFGHIRLVEDEAASRYIGHRCSEPRISVAITDANNVSITIRPGHTQVVT